MSRANVAAVRGGRLRGVPRCTPIGWTLAPSSRWYFVPHLVEFTYLRTNLDLSAGNLSQHLGVLESAGLITREKGYAGKRARTWVSLTNAGRTALAEEISQLKLLIRQIESTDNAPD